MSRDKSEKMFVAEVIDAFDARSDWYFQHASTA